MTRRSVSPLIRAALFVRDLDRASSFYRDVLGLTVVYYEGELAHPAAARLVGAGADAVVSCRILRGEGPNFGMVGLFEVKNPDPPSLRRSHRGASLSEAVLVFYCAEVAKTVALARRRGASVIAGPEEIAMPHAAQVEATIRDPEGIMINLVERDPDLAFSTHTVSP